MESPTYSSPSSEETAPQQVLNGTNTVIQKTKADFQGLANSASVENDYEGDQPLTHYHSFFFDLFTWKYPRATGFFFFSVISMITAFRFINVLRWVFKGAYLLFASAALLEVAGKPFGAKGLVSSMRPRRYHTIPRESVEKLFNEAHDLLNFFVVEFQRVIFVENIFATIVAFVTTFAAYFLIKYMPFWSLLLTATITAFTAPLIYLQNQEFIDEKIRQGNELVNEQLNTGRELTVKYAGEAAARARSTAVDLSQKAQGYAQNVRGSSPAATSKPSTTSTADKEFPSVPVHEPATNGHNGQVNGANGHNGLNGANGANGFSAKVQDEYRPEQPILA
ncbi:uncharacterized protein H6S33_004334 [Morchella sextelata]|uniref:uncharacterized protein n=1 Tax=Morchella sextelata TaxID=1174677 RepID=UPI001D05A73B|nr:uncharacterized protein H6S33_004334 [Morchella sextelata]KAH0605877.1 hypothetical protein H6S33_004334 [Morchella sextelata]